MVNRSTRVTIICVGIYIIYAFAVFLILPRLIPNTVGLQRGFIKHQMSQIGDFSNLTLEVGGTPQRSVLVTFKGSGAISLLDLLSRYPGAYHHYAPLLDHERIIRDRDKAKKAIKYLTELLNCNYTHSYPMLRYGMNVPSFQQFYGHQRSLCRIYPSQICWDPKMLQQICSLYPFINMSLYLMRLRYVAILLENGRSLISQSNTVKCLHCGGFLTANGICGEVNALIGGHPNQLDWQTT